MLNEVSLECASTPTSPPPTPPPPPAALPPAPSLDHRGVSDALLIQLITFQLVPLPNHSDYSDKLSKDASQRSCLSGEHSVILCLSEWQRRKTSSRGVREHG